MEMIQRQKHKPEERSLQLGLLRPRSGVAPGALPPSQDHHSLGVCGTRQGATEDGATEDGV